MATATPLDPRPAAAPRTMNVLFWGLVIVAARLISSVSYHLYDDAFITMRYAENLADGAGVVFNVGAAWEPILGTTTLAYTFVLAGAAAFGVPLDVFVVGFNTLCEAAIAALILTQIFPRDRRVAFLAAFLFAANPLLTRISTGGMEAPLFLLTVLTSLVLSERRRLALALCAATVSAMVRPEGVLVIGVVAVSHIRQWRRLLLCCPPGAALGVAYLVVTTTYFGSPVPHSVVAKSSHAGDAVGRAIMILRESFLPMRAFALLLPFQLVGVAAMLRRGGVQRSFTAWVLLLTAAYLAAHPHTWGWYFYPVLVGGVLWAATGIVVCMQRLWPVGVASVERRWKPAWTTAAFGAALAPSLLIAAKLGPSTVRDRVYDEMRRWAAAHLRPSHRVLAYDIGAIGYYSDATILDAAGLVWPDAVKVPDQIELMRRNQPDYVLLTATRANVGALRDDALLSAAYVPVARFSAQGKTDLEPPLEQLPPVWRQDYIVYKRASSVVAVATPVDE